MEDRNRIITFNAPTDQSVSMEFKFSIKRFRVNEFLKELPHMFPDAANLQKIPHQRQDDEIHQTWFTLYVSVRKYDSKFIDSYIKVFIDLSNFKPKKAWKAIHNKIMELTCGRYPIKDVRITGMRVKLPLDYKHFA